MKTYFTSWLATSLFCMFSALQLCGQTTSIQVDIAGNLPQLISSTEKHQITSLKITGMINGTDLLFLREMAGSDEKGNQLHHSLTLLDLSEASIVQGGTRYFVDEDNNSYFSKDNTLGDYTFSGCETLQKVILPRHLKTLGKKVFLDCKQLQTIDLRSNLQILDEAVLDGCSNLISIIFPSDLKEIGKWAFYGCEKLQSVTLPSTTTKIGNDAFRNCYSLNDIQLSTSLQEIGNNAFRSCTKLQTLNMPNTITHIGQFSFAFCKLLTNVSFPTQLKQIGQGAFMACGKLDSIILPKTLQSIGTEAFSGCESLHHLVLPTTIQTISSGCFSYCDALPLLTLPASIKTIKSGAFEDCDGLTEIHCFCTNPPSVNEEIFSPTIYKQATLYVPKGSKTAYLNTTFWKNFDQIVEMDDTLTALTIPTISNLQATHIYDLLGHPLSHPQTGWNLIIHQDGSSQKIWVK